MSLNQEITSQMIHNLTSDNGQRCCVH